jgi:hypothetical protein
MPHHRSTTLCVVDVVLLLGVILCVGVLDLRSAQAGWNPRAPWCAYLGGFGGNFDCAYYSLEQCLATARGLGGYCSPNPRAFYQPPPPPPPRRIRR